MQFLNDPKSLEGNFTNIRRQRRRLCEKCGKPTINYFNCNQCKFLEQHGCLEEQSVSLVASSRRPAAD